MLRLLLNPLSLLVLIFLCGCERDAKQAHPANSNTPVVVYTTFYPLTYFAERIGGDLVKVVCPCPPDSDPATWMPDNATIAAYQSADLILINGASFEGWVSRASLPESRLVDTTKPMADEFIVLEERVTHSHGPEGEHAHEGVDGHTWLDPDSAKRQAGRISDALVRVLGEHRAAIERGHVALCADLDELDKRLADVSALLGDRALLASHPAYNYLARSHGWKIKNVHLDPMAVVDEESVAAVAQAQKATGAKITLWEAEPLAETSRALRERLGIVNVVYSPCESAPEEGDYLSVQRGNVERLAAVLAQE